MLETLPRLACLLLLVTWTSFVPAADAIRLRPLTSIYVDSEGVGLDGPEGVGCGPSSTLVVADTDNGRLLFYRVTDEVVLPDRIVTLPTLPRPMLAEIAADGEIFVFDRKLRRIARLDPAGKFLGYVEPREETGSYGPRSFALDPQQNLVVLDVLSERVLVMQRTGEIQRRIGFPESYGSMSDLTVDDGGTVFVIDSVGKTIFAAAPGAATLEPLSARLDGIAQFPATIVADRRGQLFVADRNGGSILVFGTGGDFRARQSGQGWKQGLLRNPSKMCVDANDRLFVADRANNRVQVFAILR